MTTYQVRNLDCADCASRIEQRIVSLTSVKYASLNFASASLTIDTDDLAGVREEIRKLEPAVEIVATAETGPAAAESEARKEKRSVRRELAVISLLGAGYGASFVLGDPAGRIFFTLIWILAGYRVFRAAAFNIRTGKIFDENFLMTLATVGALLIGAFSEAAGVMLFYRVGEFLEGLSLAKSRRSIKALLALKPDYAEVWRAGAFLRTAPENVAAGELILVRPGERIPLDGIVEEGSSWIDTAAITGESVPRPAAPGTEVLGGSVNVGGLLRIRTVREYGESAAARILRLVEESAGRKSKTERFMTRFAGYYTPAVMAAALLTAAIPPIFIPGELFKEWFYRALTILVISCPCALVVSIPLGYFGGLGAAARRGILIKGSNFIDVLGRVRTVVFDKTGTLTRGTFKVLALRPSANLSDGSSLLEIAAAAEAGSNHPIALSLRAAYEMPLPAPEAFEEIPGNGIRALVGGRRVLVGSGRFLAAEGVPIDLEADSAGPAGSVSVHVAADGAYAGRIDVGDEIRPGAAEAVEALRLRGVGTVMLSGDTRERAEKVGFSVGIRDVRGDLLPGDKARVLLEIKAASPGLVAFVGDGINDTPVLAGADAGIAMGGIGQDAAVETADIVILDDDPRKVALALAIAERTRRIVLQNISFALGIKLLFVLGGAAGIAGMWEAVFADVGVAVLAVLNSMRAMKTRRGA